MESSSNGGPSRTRNINENGHPGMMRGVVKATYNLLSDNGNKNKDTRADVANSGVTMLQDLPDKRNGAMEVDDDTIVVDHPGNNSSGRFFPLIMVMIAY